MTVYSIRIVLLSTILFLSRCSNCWSTVFGGCEVRNLTVTGASLTFERELLDDALAGVGDSSLVFTSM